VSEQGLCLFLTPLGRAGIAWGPRGVCAVNLPEAHDALVRTRLCARLSEGAGEEDPPAHIARIVQRICALLQGEPDDLRDVSLDMTGIAEFAMRVYEAARAIPVGRTQSYGELARSLGAPGAARAVGQALGKNPFAPVVPCHRVLAASGALGGFSAHGGGDTKRRMLAIEGAGQLPLFR
jgi:methylated-DNA-[protein]-cysteine S-methyltransferase